MMSRGAAIDCTQCTVYFVDDKKEKKQTAILGCGSVYCILVKLLRRPCMVKESFSAVVACGEADRRTYE